MPEQTPIDPLAAMHALVAAWNRGQADAAAPPPAAKASPALADIAQSLGRIEETLLRLEALAVQREAREVAAATAAADRLAAKRHRKDKR